MAEGTANQGAGKLAATPAAAKLQPWPTEATEQSDRIRVLTIAPLVGEAIRRIADESSVSSLFD